MISSSTVFLVIRSFLQTAKVNVGTQCDVVKSQCC